MASATYDHSKVNALDLPSRRVHMEAFFKHLGLWDSVKVAKTREKCVEMFCQFLNKNGYTTISQQYFEYEVDALVWYNTLKRGKVLTDATKWPWSDTIPKKIDSTIPFSLVYRDWLRRKSRAEGGNGGETKPPKATPNPHHAKDLGDEVASQKEEIASLKGQIASLTEELDSLKGRSVSHENKPVSSTSQGFDESYLNWDISG
ncbi:hypothetical protein FGADI_2328 [Fusarium gaditjirri]|uniref:Uncharacterized protein n=1 Tax=Fusarium gaditjirri TaxID=282569 RepID=A0A8H4TIB0_9HYPO|nr:hypothetical protein FGADI_2328 [Fusarium gaditjirri]